MSLLKINGQSSLTLTILCLTKSSKVDARSCLAASCTVITLSHANTRESLFELISPQHAYLHIPVSLQTAQDSFIPPPKNEFKLSTRRQHLEREASLLVPLGESWKVFFSALRRRGTERRCSGPDADRSSPSLSVAQPVCEKRRRRRSEKVPTGAAHKAAAPSNRRNRPFRRAALRANLGERWSAEPLRSPQGRPDDRRRFYDASLPRLTTSGGRTVCLTGFIGLVRTGCGWVRGRFSCGK